jgi:hypothetical protein
MKRSALDSEILNIKAHNEFTHDISSAAGTVTRLTIRVENLEKE